MKRAFRLLALGAAPILLLLLVQVPPLWRLAGEPRLAQWDMAKYGVSGLRLAGAIATADLPLLLRELNALSVWPPLFPLLEAPCFLVFGKGEAVASRLVLLLFAAALLLLPWALAPLSARRSPAAGWLAAAAVASAGLYHSFATLAMLEVPGFFLQVLALGFTLRALRSEPGAWRATYLCCTLLFFCKYNYGLLYIVPLLVFRARLGVAEWSDFGAMAGKFWRSGRWRSPLLLGGAAAVLALALLRATGGLEFAAFGRPVSIRSIGNPALLLLWLALLAALWGRERRRALLRRLAEIDGEQQGLLRYLAAPILLWLLVPPHLKDFLDFVENRSSPFGFFSAESLLFYPRVFLAAFSPGYLAGGAILLLALAGLAWLRGSQALSFLGLWLLVAGGAVALHPYKLDRFFFPVALAVVALAAAVASRALEALPGRFGKLPAMPIVAGLLALAAAAAGGLRASEVRRELALRSVPAAVGEVLDAVLETTAGAGREQPALLLGTWNLASPWLVEWRAWQSSAGWSRPALPLLPRQLAGRPGGEALAAKLTAGPPLVLLLEPLAENGSYAAETAELAPALARLGDGALFRAEPGREFPAAGYRLRAWRRR